MKFKLVGLLITFISLSASNIEILLTDNIKPFIDKSSPPKGILVDRIEKTGI